MKKKTFKTLSFFITLLGLFFSAQTFAGPASLNPSFDTGLPVGFNNTVNAVLVQSNEKIIAGGNFTLYQSVGANRLTRLNSDGTKDYLFDIGSGFNGNINTLAFGANEKIFVGGSFTDFNGATHNRIIKLNADGTKDTSFDVGSGFNVDVLALAAQDDGKVIVGGKFTTYQSTAINRIARLNVDGSIDDTFIVGSGFPADVNSIVIQDDGKILVGGSFTTYSGVTANRFVRLNTDGTLDTGFSGGTLFNNIVYAIALQTNGQIVVGGQFTTYSGVTANRIARLNTDGTRDTTFAATTGLNNIVYTLAVQDDQKVLVGGSFTSYDGITSNRFVRLNTDGSKDESFVSGAGFINIIKSIGLNDNLDITLGGAFNAYSGQPANRIIRLHEDGSKNEVFDTGNGFDNTVITLKMQNDGDVLVGGAFSTYGGTTTNYITRLNADGTKDTTFLGGFNNSVFDFAEQSDGKIAVGGFFTYPYKFARINIDGTVDTGFNNGGSMTNSSVFVIETQDDDKIVVGGLFTTYSGVSAKYLVRLNADGTRDDTFAMGAGLNNEVDGLAIQDDGKILVGGDFTTYSGVTANKLIRLNTDGTRDETFDIGSGFNAIIWGILLQDDGKILVVGAFTDFNGEQSNRLIRLNTDGSRDTSFDVGSGFNDGLSIALQPDGKIIAGGSFTNFNGEQINRLVRLNTDGSRDTSFDVGSGFNDNIRDLIVKDDGQIVVGGRFTAYNNAPVGYLVFLYGESEVVDLPNSTDTTTVINEFTDKGYTRTNGDLDGSVAVSLLETDGEIPVNLSLKNQDIKMTIPAETQFTKADETTNYDGIIAVPIEMPVQSINDENVVSAFTVGSSSESLRLTGGVATLSAPVPTQSIGNIVQVWYSEDHGVTWYPHIVTNVVNDSHGDEYANFNTNHFTDFAVTVGSDSFAGSFVINDDDASTDSKDTTLSISSTPAAGQMRFSNDNATRTDWEAYATSKSWTLTGAAGTKTVYIELDLDSDNDADVYLSDAITYEEDVVVIPTPTSYPQTGPSPILFKDACPETRDCSDSYYDSLCGPCPETISTGHKAADNVCSINGSQFSTELNNAYQRACNYNITTMPSIQQANIEGTLIRKDMAKMITNFAVNVLDKSISTGATCEFSDTTSLSKEAQYYAMAACRLGLMGYESDGVTVNKTFDPEIEVDRSQFGAILSRLLRGNKNNGGTPYYTKHLSALKKEEIMTKTNTPFQQEMRGWVMVMMQRIFEKK